MFFELINRYTIVTQGCAVLFVLIFLIFLFDYFFRLYPATRSRAAKAHGESRPREVSIIVVVYDSIRFIRNTLPQLLTQEYEGEFEVIVVNHTPKEPSTKRDLETLLTSYKNLYVTTLKQDNHFSPTNKLALSLGVKAAKYENLLLVSPHSGSYSPHWLTEMSKGFTGERNIVLGYSQIRQKEGLANRFYRAANVHNAIKLFSKATAGKPYRALHLNMGFSKQLFFENKGFGGHANINLGEQDLFIQQTAPFVKTNVILSPEATSTINESAPSIRKWYVNRAGEYLTFPYYTVGAKSAIISPFIGQFLYYASAAATLYFAITLQYRELWIITTGTLLVGFLLQFLLLHRFGRSTETKIPYISVLLYNLYLPIDGIILFLIKKCYYTKKRIWR